MGAIRKIFTWANRKNELQVSGIIYLFSKYGPCKAKMYKHKGREYLLLMSEKMDTLEEHMAYIYESRHHEHALESKTCSCNNQIDIALKMIIKEKGFIIYYTQSSQDMENCLYKIGAYTSKLTEQEFKVEIQKEFFKSCTTEYCVLTSIVEELDTVKMNLVSNDPGIALHLQRVGIELVKWASVITFEYGESNV
jgi:GTP cyclohydrolase II